jgi:hypothetical protein
MKLKTKEPPHRTFASFGYVVKNFMTMNTLIMTNLNPSWYETKLEGRRHKGYKGYKASHRALQI